jgi:DHA3 family macrolide efflux protein-like MFS transporter
VTRPLTRQISLLRGAVNFRLLFVATFGSSLGTWMANVALTVDVEQRTNSTWWVSALLIVSFLPSVVVGLAAGPLIDRLSRKRLMVIADVTRLLVFCAVPFVGNALSIVVLAAVAGLANAFFRPAALAGVPNLVSDADLAYGTSLLQGTDWIGLFAGSIIGGAIISAWSPDPVYWINAATFLFSALLIVRIPDRFLQSEQGITRGHWRDLRDGLSAVVHSRALVTALVSLGFAVVATGLVNTSEIFLATRSLNSTAFGFGLLWGATGVGLIAGSLLMGRLVEDRDPTSIYPWAFLPWAAGVLGAAIAPNIWLAAIAMVLAGVGNGLTFPLTVLIIQRWTSDRLRGRAFTVIISVHNALIGLSMVAAGALTAAVGARWVYGLGAALLLAGGVTAYVLTRDLQTESHVAGEPAT